jgi:hypothetical protein
MKESQFAIRVRGKELIALKEKAESEGKSMTQFAREKINFEAIISEKDAKFNEWNNYSLGLLKQAKAVIEIKNKEIANLKKQIK